ncbi:hypothetical protein BDZ31_001695 [Conexibacter arvalis]|uniref:Uncharacterized protein n=1 Tax=Conexibacter arvalis TaxID=912552 RepID=A0A840IBR2_9ACTN|nr:hypothetical protein [Conexibacter arvalis]
MASSIAGSPESKPRRLWRARSSGSGRRRSVDPAEAARTIQRRGESLVDPRRLRKHFAEHLGGLRRELDHRTLGEHILGVLGGSLEQERGEVLMRGVGRGSSGCLRCGSMRI